MGNTGTVTYHDPQTNNDVTIPGRWAGVTYAFDHPHFVIERPDGTHLYVPMDGADEPLTDETHPLDFALYGGVV